MRLLIESLLSSEHFQLLEDVELVPSLFAGLRHLEYRLVAA